MMERSFLKVGWKNSGFSASDVIRQTLCVLESFLRPNGTQQKKNIIPELSWPFSESPFPTEDDMHVFLQKCTTSFSSLSSEACICGEFFSPKEHWHFGSGGTVVRPIQWSSVCKISASLQLCKLFFPPFH